MYELRLECVCVAHFKNVRKTRKAKPKAVCDERAKATKTATLATHKHIHIIYLYKSQPECPTIKSLFCAFNFALRI